MNPSKNFRVLQSILVAVALVAAVSMACNLPSVKPATPAPAVPIPTATLLPLPSLAPTVPPPPTPTQAPQDIPVQNGTVTLTVNSQKKEIRFEPPDDGDISGLKASAYSLSWASLVIVTDSAGGYLSEYRFVADTDPETVSVVLKPVKYAPYSQYNVNAVNLGELLTDRKGEASLASLPSGLASLKAPDDFGLILGQPASVSDAQTMVIYATHLANVLVALPADIQDPAVVLSAVVLSVHEASSLPAMADLLKAQTRKISIADFTGLSLKDLADLQIREPSKLAKPEQEVGYFGNTQYEVKYNQKQIQEFTYYVKNVVVIDKPCGSPDMKDRIFAMEPAAGSEVVPRDARITLYRCETVNQQPVTAVDLQVAPPAEPCQIKPASGLMDVTLVMDISSSMQGLRLARAKEAAITFLKTLDPQNTRVGLATFESEAKTLSQLTNDFDRLTGLIAGLTATGGTAIDAGLQVGESILAADERPDTARAVLLLSDGMSAVDPALQAAAKIKARGAKILTVGVGSATDQTLLSAIASSRKEFIYVEACNSLQEAFTTQALRLRYGGQTVARNALIRFKFNTEKYALVESLLDHAGRAVGYDTVEWFVPEIFPDQVINLPAVLRPLDASTDQPLGTLDVTYDQCTDGPSASLPPQSITQASAQAAATTRQVIEFEQPKTSTLVEFKSVSYLLDPNTPGVFSVVTEGAGSELPPDIHARSGTERLSPLYTVWRKAEKKRISTYYLEEPRLYWLTLQSNSLDDKGDYSVTIQRGEVVDLPPLDIGAAAKVKASLDANDARVYDLRGVKEGDYVTVVTTNLYPAVVGMDGWYNMRLFWLSKGTTITSIFWVKGNGPYRLIMPNTDSPKPVAYTLSATASDLASQAMGKLVPETPAQGQFSTQATQLWTFDGKKGQGFDLMMVIDQPQPNAYLYYGFYGPDATEMTWAGVEDASRLGWTQLDQDGTYLLVVMRPYTGGKAVDYIAEVFTQSLPEATAIEVKSGDAVRDTVINQRRNDYVVKIEPGQALTANVSLSPTIASGLLNLLDPQGQACLTAQSYDGRLTLGPVNLRIPGEYTLRLETYAWVDATYELTVELK